MLQLGCERLLSIARVDELRKIIQQHAPSDDSSLYNQATALSQKADMLLRNIFAAMDTKGTLAEGDKKYLTDMKEVLDTLESRAKVGGGM